MISMHQLYRIGIRSVAGLLCLADDFGRSNASKPELRVCL